MVVESGVFYIRLLQWFPNWGAGPPGGAQSHCKGGAKDQGRKKSETKLNEYDLCRGNKQMSLLFLSS